MKQKEQVSRAGGISSDAVLKATGKTWAQWFAILDRASARKLTHKGLDTRNLPAPRKWRG